jgi:mannose-6-phosphate isomerase class I
MASSYDKTPVCDSGFSEAACTAGWDFIVARISPFLKEDCTLCIETYPGVLESEIEFEFVHRLRPSIIVRASEAYQDSSHIEAAFSEELTDDPVFGRISQATIQDFFDPELFLRAQQKVRNSPGTKLVIGTGATLIASNADCTLYADMARWEIQLRQRRSLVGNLGIDNLRARASEKYKRAYFLDWRVADRLKTQALPIADFILDTNQTDRPLMIARADFQAALARVVQSPLRLVPFFDPGPWGGQWMKEKFDLPPEQPNYAWCFDCVPEENSLLLGFGNHRFEIPAIDLVLFQSDTLLGNEIQAKFGKEFPIRFDLLDTMGGGNLSFQVHPLTEYIQKNFSMEYTQDESYYMLDAGQNAAVYLGLRENVSPEQFEAGLRRAQTGEIEFPVDDFANRIPAHKHDHFLIPAGTPHCSGANCMVLEISATPYIFTFKLWDWGRLGLDGRPRPIHIDHGMRNMQWNRSTEWTHRELVNAVETVAQHDGWHEEKTGLHALEFIETRRYWFQDVVPLSTNGTVNVLNLVEGESAIVASPTDRFAPFTIHYAETFVVPACVGEYTIRPGVNKERCGLIRAYVAEQT